MVRQKKLPVAKPHILVLGAFRSNHFARKIARGHLVVVVVVVVVVVAVATTRPDNTSDHRLLGMGGLDDP